MAKATGPRTLAGKEISKRNSLKHGIFSKVVLLQNESRPEFDSLLSGLRKDFQPKVTREEILVEKLATLLWRYRRFLIAEAAEIQKGSAFLEWDENERQQEDKLESFYYCLQFSVKLGLLKRIANPKVLNTCIALLTKIESEIKTNGFGDEVIPKLLLAVYGNYRRDETLFESYEVWKKTAQCSDEERAQKGYASVEKCESDFLSLLEEEIERLKQYREEKATIDAERMELESLRHNVPEGPQLDRLLKYEASINRDIDRTLTQLERLQRMRLGQPVSSPIKLDISS